MARRTKLEKQARWRQVDGRQGHAKVMPHTIHLSTSFWMLWWELLVPKGLSLDEEATSVCASCFYSSIWSSLGKCVWLAKKPWSQARPVVSWVREPDPLWLWFDSWHGDLKISLICAQTEQWWSDWVKSVEGSQAQKALYGMEVHGPCYSLLLLNGIYTPAELLSLENLDPWVTCLWIYIHTDVILCWTFSLCKVRAEY